MLIVRYCNGIGTVKSRPSQLDLQWNLTITNSVGNKKSSLYKENVLKYPKQK